MAARRSVQPTLLMLGAVNGASFGLLMSVVAPYMYSLGFTGTQFGVITSLSVASGIVATLASGYLSDAFGARRVVSVGLLLRALAALLIASGSAAVMALGFLVQGFAMGFTWAAVSALVARSGDDSRLHYTFSYVAASSTLGAAAGSFSGFLPVALSGWLGISLVDAYRLVIAGLAPLSVASVPLALAARETGVSRRRAGPLEAVRAFKAIRPLRVLVAYNAVVGFGAAMSIHNIGYYFAAKYGVTSAEIGLVVGVEQLAMAALMAVNPRLADRVGSPLKVYLALTSASLPLLVAMTLTDSFAVASALFIVRTVLMNAANPLLEATIMRLVPRELRGSAGALMSLSFTLPATAGRAFGGALLDVNLELPLRATAALYAASIAFLARRRGEIESWSPQAGGVTRGASSPRPVAAPAR